VSTITTSVATSTREAAVNHPALSEIVAQHNNAEDQCCALEVHVLKQFEAASSVSDEENKRKTFWSIAQTIFQQSRQLISPQSLPALAASGGNERFWNRNWYWQEKLQSEIGPPRPQSMACLGSTSRANHELRMFNLVLGTVNHVLWDLAPHEFTAPRRPYTVKLDGEYPLQWADGTPAVVQFDANPDLDPALLERIKPYIDPARSNADRAALYHTNLDGRRMNESDLTCPQEKALIGQWGVFAKRRIPAETCLGIYGGTLLDEEHLITIADRRYLAKGEATEPQYVVNGENIMSLLNTILLFDADGQVIAQDTQQHNVRSQPFSCKTTSGDVVSLIAFFSSQEIEQDSELRWNYGYDERALVRNGLR